MKTWTTASKSNPGRLPYVSKHADDGKLLCDCPGWIKAKRMPRFCTHHKDYVAAQRLTVETRGDYVFVVNGTSTPSLPSRVPKPASTLQSPPAVRVSQATADRAQKAAPMLASAMVDRVEGAAFDARFGDPALWAMEEKINGHRCVCIIEGGTVTAFSRPRTGPAKVRELPAHITAQLVKFPDCITDGEVVAASGQHWDVPTGGGDVLYVIFDLPAFRAKDLTGESYDVRRAALMRLLKTLPAGQRAISTVESVPPTWAGVAAILARDGEGVIVKRRASVYQPGYRSPDWIKVKKPLSATLVIYGFEAGKSGPTSKMQLRDAEGRVTTCKTLTNKLIRETAATPTAFYGRRVVVQFPCWTPSGGYGGPVIFDHFAGKGE